MDDNIKTLMRKRDYLHRKAIRSNSQVDWKAYKSTRNKVISLIRHAKETYYKRRISEDQYNPKGIWKTLKKLLPKPSKTHSNAVKAGNKIISSPSTVADRFNNFFQYGGLQSQSSQFTHSPSQYSYLTNSYKQRSVQTQTY